MKVLQVNAVNGIRSTGRLCVEIAEYLNSNRHEGYIAYSTGLKYRHGYKIGSRIDVRIHGLFSRIFGLQAYYSKSSTKKLLKYIEQLKPDVVHLHNLHSNYINLELLLKYLAVNDIPTVVTLHDCWFYTGKCTHYSTDKCNRWKDKCGNCPRLRKDNKSYFLDFSQKMLIDKRVWFENIPRLTVIGVSDWITNEAKSSILSSAKNIIRIYNWIDLEIFKPIPSNEMRTFLGIGNRFVILGVSSEWSNTKGLNHFIELAKSISEDMVIVLVGKSHHKSKLPVNIIHVDETNNIDELATYYSMADVLLNLSREESFGKVSAEALACGTPIIVLNSTANPELVGNGCGYIIDDINYNTILKSIDKIKINTKTSYSDNCRKFAKKNFNIIDRLNDLGNLYKAMIEIEVKK